MTWRAARMCTGNSRNERMSVDGPDIVLPKVGDTIGQRDAMLRRFGGLPGLRDMGLLDSAVGRVGQAILYRENMNAAEAASLLCWTIVRNHPFIDGNKRAGYAAPVTTLAVNGLRLRPEFRDDDIADRIIGPAAGECGEDAFQDWVDSHVVEDGTYRILSEHDSRHGPAALLDEPGDPPGFSP